MPLRLLLAAATAALALVGVLAAACPAAGPAPASGPRAAADAPNIVLITTDDQTLAELRWMPRARHLLGGAGTTFTGFVAPQPLCCPSRAQLLTGQYSQNNGVRSNVGRRGGHPAFHPETALPVWLQSAGYRTAFVGKYLNLYPGTGGPEVGWDTWDATVGAVYQYHGFGQYDGSEVTTPEGYHTTYVADRTVELIEEHAGADEPFFLWSSFVAPHGICSPGQETTCATPPLVEEQHADAYPDARAPFLDDPGFNAAVHGGVHRSVEGTGPVDPTEQQRLFHQRIRALASVDDAVAEVVGTLERLGELDETLVVFTSDNGYLFGEHRYSGKVLAYEQSVRVPLLVRGPGVAAGARLPGTAAMIDLAPTLAEVAGADPLVEVDGRSLVTELAGATRLPDRTLLVQAGVPGPDPKDLGWKYRGVRTDRYTYVRWQKSGAEELFDRRRDPHQLVNAARRPAYAAVRRELVRRTRLLGGCAGVSCRVHLGPSPGLSQPPRRRVRAGSPRTHPRSGRPGGRR